MPIDTYVSRKQEIEQEILKLQKQAEQLQLQERKPAIASIIRSMVEFEITPEEITEAYNQKNIVKTASGTKRPTRPAPIKYRHPDTGETWSGRGKAPRWITEEEGRGRSRQDFRLATPEPVDVPDTPHTPD